VRRRTRARTGSEEWRCSMMVLMQISPLFDGGQGSLFTCCERTADLEEIFGARAVQLHRESGGRQNGGEGKKKRRRGKEKWVMILTKAICSMSLGALLGKSTTLAASSRLCASCHRRYYSANDVVGSQPQGTLERITENIPCEDARHQLHSSFSLHLFLQQQLN
jgi:hypothetical protein